ncbi:MAG: hypothetical protein HY327_00650, partial [Chloroflexi bacterium]|nr:hypothetical protein [Chloroflexota bacterium]
MRQVCLIFLCSHFLLYASSARAQAPLFTSFTTRDGLAADYITSIAFEKSGAAWIGTPKGATRIEGNYWVTYTTAHGLGNDFVNGIAVGANNRVYFATFGGGLTVFDGASRKTYTTANSQIPSNYLIAVAVDKQNRVWVATFGAGFARLDGEQWARFNLPDNYINALTLDANGHAWIATNGGAYYFEGQSATPVTQNSGLASNRVLSIAVAPNGSVWFGTDNGVTVRETAARFRTFREADGLANNFAKAIAVDAQNRVWIGTPRGLTQFDGKAWKTFLPADGLSDNVIAILAIDPNNNAWIGTPRGLSVAGISLERTTTLPVVLVHGWRTADSDLVDDGEFRFLVQYLERDGVQVFYAAGISPTQTLLQNAARLRDVIAAAKAKTGAPKVDLIAFSMGGLNARAFLESTLYENDVRRAIILGTPQAGVRLWLPFLAREIEDRPAEPSGVELT